MSSSANQPIPGSAGARTPAPPGQVASWRELLGGPSVWALLVLSFGVWLHAADATLIATLLPKAIEDIGGDALVHWTLVLYNVGSIVAGAAAVVTARRLGLKETLIVSGIIYAAGCAVSAIGPSMVEMLIGRAVQGIGGGGLVALTLVSAHDRFDDRLRPRVLALISAVWGAASFLGPFTGGIFAALGFWRMGFWCFALQGVLYVVAVAAVLSNDGDRSADEEQAASAPIGRLCIFAVAALALASAGVKIDPVTTPALLVLGGLSFWAFYALDQRARTDRLFPRGFLVPNTVVGGGILGIMALSGGSIAFALYGPVILFATMNVGPLAAGYLIALESVAWSLAAILVSGASGRTLNRIVLIGAGLIAICPPLFAIAVPADQIWAMILLLILQGTGFGMCFALIVHHILTKAAADDRNRASGAIMPLQTIGYTLGAAVCGLFANAAGFADGISAEAARSAGFWIFLGSFPLTAIGFWALWRMVALAARIDARAE